MGFPSSENIQETPNVELGILNQEETVQEPVEQAEINSTLNIDLDVLNQEETVQESAEQAEINSPLNATFNIEQKNENNIITSITPAKFDGLLKILNLLTDSNDPVIIKNSSITKNLTSGAIITANVKDVFDNEDINLHITNPKKNIKLFKAFKNNNNIFITEDDENSRYIVMNGEIRLFLPKQDESIQEFETDMPSLEGVNGLAQIKIDKETKNIISELSKDSEYIEYLFQDDKLKAIHIPETAIYLFENYIKDKEASKLDETNSQLTLRSTAFLPVTAENYELNIGKLSDGSYCSYTICDTGYIKVNIYEELEDTTGGSIF